MHLPKSSVNIYYYQEHKVLDSQRHQPNKTSHTRRVSSRHTQASISPQQPPQQPPQGDRRSYSRNTADSEQSKNQSGTAIISSVDYYHGSGEGGAGNGVKGVVSLTSHNLNLGFTSQSDVHAHTLASSETSTSESDSPSERSKSIFSINLQLSKRHDFEDIIGMNHFRNLHNFTLDSPDSPVFNTIESNQPLGSLDTFRTIQHPNSDEDLISGIDDILELSWCKGEQYVPISDQAECSKNYHMQNLSEYSPYSVQSDFQSAYEESNPWRPDDLIVERTSFNEQLMTPPAPMLYVDDFLMSVNKKRDINASMQDITKTKFEISRDLSSLRPAKFLKSHGEDPLLSNSEFSVNSHLYNDETEYHHDDTTSQSGSPLMYKSEKWLTRRQICSTPLHLGGVKAISKTSFESTASNIHNHMIPSITTPSIITPSITTPNITTPSITTPSTTMPHAITLSTRSSNNKLVTKVSFNGTKSTEEHKAGWELRLQPGKSNPPLLPSQLDKYWIGPDKDNNFVCIYENCNKKFTRKYNVRTHIQTHLGDRPFVCKICGKGFVRRHDFNRHTRLHTASEKSRKALGNNIKGFSDNCNEWSKYEVVFNSCEPFGARSKISWK